ncbi:coenzyme F420-0:L-glutamate ligase [Pilimelia anulata]
MSLRIIPVPGIGEVRPGADLAALVHAAAPDLADGDVVVVTSKIVSKAEGRLVPVPAAGPAREAARAAALRAESVGVVAARGATRIVRTRHGFVLNGAGIDASNVPPGVLALLPVDPDASARALRTALRERYGRRVAVIVSDTAGRAWRIGQTDLALGCAGLPPLRDHRGTVDPYGNPLTVTQIAVADELAAAAELVKGKTAGVPVVLVRGYPLTGAEPDGPGVAALLRPAAEDMFGEGAAEAYARGLADGRAAADDAARAGTPAGARGPAGAAGDRPAADGGGVRAGGTGAGASPPGAAP